MSLLDRLDVPDAQSRASTRPTVSPLVTASRAAPAPTTPPPTTRMSSSVPLDSSASAFSRNWGPNFGDRIGVTPFRGRGRPAAGRRPPDHRVTRSPASVHVDPVERALHGLLPLRVALFPLLL